MCDNGHSNNSRDQPSGGPPATTTTTTTALPPFRWNGLKRQQKEIAKGGNREQEVHDERA